LKKSCRYRAENRCQGKRRNGEKTQAAKKEGNKGSTNRRNITSKKRAPAGHALDLQKKDIVWGKTECKNQGGKGRSPKKKKDRPQRSKRRLLLNKGRLFLKELEKLGKSACITRKKWDGPLV